MKDRFVKNVGGKTKLISDVKKTKDLESLVRVQNEIMSQSTYLQELNSKSEKDTAEIANVEEKISQLQGQESALVATIDDNDTYTKIQVADGDFNNSGAPEWWVVENDAVRKPTSAEKDQRVVEANQVILNENLNSLYNSAVAYQNGPSGIDANTKAELDKAEVLFEMGKVTPDQLPKNKELADWLELLLWNTPEATASNKGSYYAKKKNILAGNPITTEMDFSDIGPAPWSYADIRAERKTVLASL
jgi:hypothetical protein